MQGKKAMTIGEYSRDIRRKSSEPLSLCKLLCLPMRCWSYADECQLKLSFVSVMEGMIPYPLIFVLSVS